MPQDETVNSGEKARTRRKKRTRFLDITSYTVLGVVVGLIAFEFVPIFRYNVLLALGRSPHCPYDLAVKSWETAQAFHERLALMMRESRVIEKDEEGYWLWDTPAGQYWAPPGRGEGLPRILAEKEEHIYGGTEAGVRPGDIVLDCGAHVGTFTRDALKAGAALVVAIEPSQATVGALHRNFKQEIAEGRVIVYEKGVWDQETVLPFYVDEDHAVDRVYVDHPDVGQLNTIPLTTIDKIVAELELPRVDFIKMDIEGSEKPALRGAEKTLATHKPRMAIAAYHLPEDQEQIPILVEGFRSDYEMKCGMCGERDLRIEALTYWFY